MKKPIVVLRCWRCNRAHHADRVVAKGGCPCGGGGGFLSPTNPTLREKVLILLGLR